MSKATTLAVAAGLLMASSAMAEVITTDSIYAFSSHLSDYNRNALYAVNDSFDSGNTIPDSSAAGHTNNPHMSMWLTGPLGVKDPNPYLIIDLASTYDIGSMHVWNYNEMVARGVNEVQILSTNDPVNGPWADRGTFNLTQASGSTGDMGQSYAFASSFQARYVKLDINSNHGDPTYYGLSEIQFSVVPEPAALGMIALSGLVMLHRKRA